MTALVTLQGRALFAAAAADGGNPVVLQSMAFGDGGGVEVTPLETATGLVNEVYRIGIQSAVPDPNDPNWLVIKAILPSDAGPFAIREIGIFNADNILVAVSAYPKTDKQSTAQGVDTTLKVEFVLVFSDTANVTLQADPGTYATQAYVDQQIPPFASVPETVAGEIADRKTHPAGVKAAIQAALAALPADQFLSLASVAQTVDGTDTAKATHAAGVKAAIQAAIQALPAHNALALASIADTVMGTDTATATHPAGVKAAIQAAIDALPVDQVLTLAGIPETITGTDTTKATHPAGVKAAIDAAVAAAIAYVFANLPADQFLELASTAETVAGTDTAKAAHPAGVKAAIDANRHERFFFASF